MKKMKRNNNFQKIYKISQIKREGNNSEDIYRLWVYISNEICNFIDDLEIGYKYDSIKTRLKTLCISTNYSKDSGQYDFYNNTLSLNTNRFRTSYSNMNEAQMDLLVHTIIYETLHFLLMNQIAYDAYHGFYYLFTDYLTRRIFKIITGKQDRIDNSCNGNCSKYLDDLIKKVELKKLCKEYFFGEIRNLQNLIGCDLLRDMDNNVPCM